MSEKQYSLSQLGWKAFFNQQLSLEELEQSNPYRITQVFRNRLQIWGESGELDVSLAQFPNLQTSTIGDWLLMPNEPSFAPRLLEPLSCFQRKSPGSNTNQLIASNVDTAFIVSSFNHDFNLSRIERYLALTKEAQVDAVLVLTKADLVDQEVQQTYLDQLHDLQSQLVVLCINANQSEDCKQLEGWCGVGQTCVLLGSSGVGKTTITNSLCTTSEKTATIREDDSKGRHTTTGRSLFFTQAGGLLLDCPGMRELQLTDCEEGVKAVFDDIQQLATKCKFADCEHQSEPQCAVQKAIQSGELEQRRLINFQKMLREQARNSMTIAQSHQKDREFGQLIKSSLDAKRNMRNS
ncbi:ribosome small subunit-dependent GTPase A [Paraglaciecola sp.]|uniref:ribosome small subunit-dependent GTPase A n=1 Tax=Paraglaciecola sp. TaxID=1920173 RepID=UPI003EF8AC63